MQSLELRILFLLGMYNVLPLPWYLSIHLLLIMGVQSNIEISYQGLVSPKNDVLRFYPAAAKSTGCMITFMLTVSVGSRYVFVGWRNGSSLYAGFGFSFNHI